jgi:hypothetical protein
MSGWNSVSSWTVKFTELEKTVRHSCLCKLLVAGTVFALACAAFGQQSPPPKPPGQRDPGFFGGPKEKKDKDEDANTRSLSGVVRNDQDDPVEGAVVQIKDLKTLRVRSFITKADGKYQFHGLSTNVDYEIVATHQGVSSDKKTLSVYDSRKQAVINLQIKSKG